MINRLFLSITFLLYLACCLIGDYTTSQFFAHPVDAEAFETGLGARGARVGTETNKVVTTLTAGTDGWFSETDSSPAPGPKWKNFSVGASSAWAALPGKPRVTPGNLPPPAADDTLPAADDTLAKALANATTGKTITLQAGKHVLPSSQTLPAGVTLRVLQGGVIHLNNGVTLTLNGTLDAGPYQIFSWTGNGKVRFGLNSNKGIWLAWWGAKGNGVTDDTAAIQAAINSALVNPSYVATIHASAGAAYRVSELKFDEVPFSPPPYLTFDGHDAMLWQNALGSKTLIRVSGPVRLTIRNWNLMGVTKNLSLWSRSLAQKPSAVTFDGTTGTQKGSILACTSYKDWYWEDGTLFTNVAITGSPDDPDRHYKNNIKADGVTLTKFAKFYSKGIAIGFDDTAGDGSRSPGYGTIENCNMFSFDMGIKYRYSLYNHVRDVFIQGVNCGIYVTHSGKGYNSNANTYENILIAYCTGENAIYLHDCLGQIFIGTRVEVTHGRILYADGCGQIQFNNIHGEANACINHPDVDELYYLTNCSNFQFNVSTFWGGNDEGTWRASSINGKRTIRMVSNCRSITFDTCTFAQNTKGTLYAYSTDGSCSGILMRNCILSGSMGCCEDGNPSAVWESPTLGTNAWINLMASAVKINANSSGPGAVEYCAGNYKTDWGKSSDANNCKITALDGGYDRGKCLKWEWTGTSAYGRVIGILQAPPKPPSGEYWQVVSFFYKSDSPSGTQDVGFYAGASAYFVKVLGDGVWRYCGAFGPTSYPNYSDSFKVTADPRLSSGNVYVDRISVRYFLSKAEAEAWIGNATAMPEDTIFCYGSPEGVVKAPVGTVVIRKWDGVQGKTLYIKESGTGNTGWVAK